MEEFVFLPAWSAQRSDATGKQQGRGYSHDDRRHIGFKLKKPLCEGLQIPSHIEGAHSMIHLDPGSTNNGFPEPKFQRWIFALPLQLQRSLASFQETHKSKQWDNSSHFG